jgi:hypothetical protein
MYLTIPEIVEGEEMLSMTADADGKTFAVAIGLGATAVRLMQAGANGEHLPLVVLTTGNQILALDSVYVSDFTTTTDTQSPVAQLKFLAEAVRVV